MMPRKLYVVNQELLDSMQRRQRLADPPNATLEEQLHTQQAMDNITNDPTIPTDVKARVLGSELLKFLRLGRIRGRAESRNGFARQTHCSSRAHTTQPSGIPTACATATTQPSGTPTGTYNSTTLTTTSTTSSI